MSKKLEGKVAVITGGSSGIGLATAKMFHNEGARVVITGRRQEQLDAAVKEIGEGSVGIQSDTSNMADIEALYIDIKKRYGHIDVLFANAGVATFVPFKDTDEATYDYMMNINVKGLYFTIQKVLPLLNDGASIILITSVANQKGFENTSVYSATKAAVRSLARTLSADLAGRGIRVNAVSPGPIDTPIFEKLGMSGEEEKGMKEAFADMVPMKRMGESDELAAAVLFLASDDSSFVLGEELVVSGGLGLL